jgi:hypothetical protein
MDCACPSTAIAAQTPVDDPPCTCRGDAPTSHSRDEKPPSSPADCPCQDDAFDALIAIESASETVVPFKLLDSPNDVANDRVADGSLSELASRSDRSVHDPLSGRRLLAVYCLLLC